MFSAFQTIGNNYFASLNIKDGHKLISEGIYSWIRHPLYVIFCTIWICLFLLSANFLIGITGILSYIIIFIERVPKEEKLLLSVFHDEYFNYMQNTGKFFPRRKKLYSIFNLHKPLVNK
jgi:protein-S-isoprenylcysteine O-methyltransferase Ste14